jgi:hypothetical protein
VRRTEAFLVVMVVMMALPAHFLSPLADRSII